MTEQIIPYSEIRDKIRTGDRLDFISPGPIGWLIRLATPRTHTAIIVRLRDYEGKKKRRFFLEADGIKGFSLALLSDRLDGYKGKAWWTPLRPGLDEARPYIGTAAFGMIGKKYDYVGLAKSALGHVSEGMNSLFCSEAVWAATRNGVMASPRPQDRTEERHLNRFTGRVIRDWEKIHYMAAWPGDFLKFTETYLPPVRIAMEG